MSYEVFNFLEGIFWILAAGVSFFTSRKKDDLLFVGIFSACNFFLFGVSDFFELYVGGFLDRAPWLLMWKAFCVAGICISVIWYLSIRLKKTYE